MKVGDFIKSSARLWGSIMKLNEVLASEVQRSGGRMVIERVPDSKQPSSKTLKRIEREIASQISANEAMSNRSMHYASRMSAK